MRDWVFEQKTIKGIEDIPYDETPFGFVYLIKNESTGKFYIGKKQLISVRRKKIGVREKAQTKTRKTYKTTTTETKWLTYCGSSLDLTKDIKEFGINNFHREILQFCFSKKELTYYEMKHQIENNVLISNSYNGNILNRFFRKDMKENG